MSLITLVQTDYSAFALATSQPHTIKSDRESQGAQTDRYFNDSGDLIAKKVFQPCSSSPPIYYIVK